MKYFDPEHNCADALKLNRPPSGQNIDLKR